MALDEKEQEITDLNLDQMFDVFEAADKAIPSQETDDAKNTVSQTKTETKKKHTTYTFVLLYFLLSRNLSPLMMYCR